MLSIAFDPRIPRRPQRRPRLVRWRGDERVCRFPARSTSRPGFGQQGRSEGNRRKLRRPVAVPAPSVNSHASPAATTTRLLRNAKSVRPCAGQVRFPGGDQFILSRSVAPRKANLPGASAEEGTRLAHAPRSVILFPFGPSVSCDARCKGRIASASPGPSKPNQSPP